jgi:hypothetical protein
MNSSPSLASRDPMSVILVSLSVIIVLPFKFFLAFIGFSGFLELVPKHFELNIEIL